METMPEKRMCSSCGVELPPDSPSSQCISCAASIGLVSPFGSSAQTETWPGEKHKWQIGTRIEDRWEIQRILGGPGKSGMGVVYVGYDHRQKEIVAIKTFKKEAFGQNPQIADRFRLEASAWVNLDEHPNVTRALHVKNIEDQPFLFLEFVGGG